MSVFTKIIDGELPCYKIYEDDKILSFLALDQVNLGHTLVISKEEFNHWTDVPPDIYAHLHKVSQKIGKAILRSNHERVDFRNYACIGGRTGVSSE